MVLRYLSLKRSGKSKVPDPQKSPVLNEEEEKFLQHITSEEEQPPPLPPRPVVILDNGPQVKGKDAQVALMDGADKIPLPQSPPLVEARGAAKTLAPEIESQEKEKTDDGKKKKYWEHLPKINALRAKNKDKEAAADSLASVAEAVKSGGTDLKPDDTMDEKEVKKEEEDLKNILDQLNLAAVNNRVFSFSKESEELMDKFKLVLTDLINGVPTAYNDLEQLLRGSNEQLEKMFNAMPPFLQNLVRSLPTKISAALAPEVLAAASDKPGADAKLLNPEATKDTKRSKIPSLKRLVSQQGAITAMLRSIMNFLKLRFPALMTGTNVLLSLALFLLLFVFWYCHKRGRETRLEKERLATADVSESDIEVSEVEQSEVFEPTNGESSQRSASAADKSSDRVANLPSVSDLPEPRLKSEK